MTNKVITPAREERKKVRRESTALFIFSAKTLKGHVLPPSILLTQLVPDGCLNMGRGFSFILGRRRESLNYLSMSSAVSGGTVDLVKQLERGSRYVRISTLGPLATKHLAGTLIRDHWQAHTNKLKVKDGE